MGIDVEIFGVLGGLFMADAGEIHGVLAPVGRVEAGFDEAGKAGVRPVAGRLGEAVLDRVVVNVIDMPCVVVVIAYLVLPVAVLPNGLLALGEACGVGYVFQDRIAVFGKCGFDEAPAGRKVGIVEWQGPYAMQMVGHDNDGVNLEGA